MTQNRPAPGQQGCWITAVGDVLGSAKRDDTCAPLRQRTRGDGACPSTSEWRRNISSGGSRRLFCCVEWWLWSAHSSIRIGVAIGAPGAGGGLAAARVIDASVEFGCSVRPSAQLMVYRCSMTGRYRSDLAVAVNRLWEQDSNRLAGCVRGRRRSAGCRPARHGRSCWFAGGLVGSALENSSTTKTSPMPDRLKAAGSAMPVEVVPGALHSSSTILPESASVPVIFRQPVYLAGEA